MAVDGKVTYKVDYDVADAKQSLTSLGTKITSVGKISGEIGSAMTKNITTPLLAIGGATLAGFTKISTELDNIGKSAAGVNASVEGLQALQFAGRKAGIETDKMTDVLKKVQELTTSNADAFVESGITIKDMNDEMLNSDVIFNNIIESMSDMSVEQRNATLLSLGFTEELIAMNKAMEDTEGFAANVGTGLENAISDESIDKFEQFNDQIEDIKLQLIPLGVDIAEQLLPYLEDFADWLGGDGIEKISAFVHAVADFVEQNWKLIGVLAVAGPALSTFSALVGAAMKANALISGIKATTATVTGASTSIGATGGAAAISGSALAVGGLAATFAGASYLGYNASQRNLEEFGTKGSEVYDVSDPNKWKEMTDTTYNAYGTSSTETVTKQGNDLGIVNFGGVTINAKTDLTPESVGDVSEDIMTEVTNMLQIRGVMQ